SLPTGDDRFSSDEVDPAVAFIWTHSGRFNLAGTAKLSDAPGGYQFDNGLKLPFAIDERRSWFVEWEANVPESGGSSHWANGGFQWLYRDNIQIDLNAGVGLNSRAGDYRFGVGFSIRP
ncbi:MAG: transporter, partial [Pseudomonadota bacterium]